MSTDFLKGNEPFYLLDISLEGALNPKLDFTAMKNEVKGPAHIWMIYHDRLNEIFDQQWMRYMSDLGLDIGTCMIFYRDPGYQHPSVHIDIHKATSKPSHYAINWVVDPEDDSSMVWYTWPDGYSGFEDVTMADTPYIGWDFDTFAGTEICRHTIGSKMTLVNTSMPHNVIMGDRPRWAFSIRFQRDANDGAGHSWIQSVEFFKQYMKTQKDA